LVVADKHPAEMAAAADLLEVAAEEVPLVLPCWDL